jgi:ABC-type cobalamin/Fe3+-siderophores transport system ATPase subunit
MKIAYIKLENFIGIYNGSGRLKFELDFTKTISNNVRVLLSGPNGCGKTTLLSCLHPFSGTMDGRSEIILPDRDGYKEIHFIKGEDKYIIKHH